MNDFFFILNMTFKIKFVPLISRKKNKNKSTIFLFLFFGHGKENVAFFFFVKLSNFKFLAKHINHKYIL